MRLCLVLCLLIALVLAQSSSSSIGDGLWRTFNLALLGKAPALPLTTTDALSQGWQSMESQCDSNLGIRYAYKSNSPQKSSPLTIYYNAAGQVSGLATDIYGSGAAPSKLVDMGFWIPVAKNQWTINVSFRGPSEMCSSTSSGNNVLGDRLVINQNIPSVNFSVPLTASEAYCGNWTYGSCMKTMGQHWFYDVEGEPNLTWQSENLLPIVTMYYPPTMEGTINTFFFTTPVAQPGADFVLYKPGDWETPALTPSQMCENFCNSTCSWTGVDHWSTMHIYLNSQWPTITCPGGSGPLTILCPSSSTMSTTC